MNWYEKIPININNNGDPLIDNQAENTIEKIKSLEGFSNIFHICTKAVPSENTFLMLEDLTENQKKNLFLSYSLTGLNEGKFSFEQRVEVIDRLFSILGNVTILLRPLIKGRNDNKENIDRIVKVAAGHGNRIILGGLHNEKLIKQIQDSTEQYFMDCCKANGVKYFNKTSCAVADIFGTVCKVHGYDDNYPKDLNVLDMLGYKYELWNNKILLEQASSGDLNLIRYITESVPYTKQVISRLNKVTTIGEHNYEVTSGWLSWSENNPCNIGCDYCVMSQIDYLKDRSSVGCHPKDIEKIRIDNTPKDAINIVSTNQYISYKDLRKQCECIQYVKQ